MNYTGYLFLYFISLGIAFGIVLISFRYSNIKYKDLKFCFIVLFTVLAVVFYGGYVEKDIEQEYYNNTEYTKIETKDTDYLYPQDDWYMVVDEQTGETYLRSDCLDFMNEGD